MLPPRMGGCCERGLACCGARLPEWKAAPFSCEGSAHVCVASLRVVSQTTVTYFSLPHPTRQRLRRRYCVSAAVPCVGQAWRVHVHLAGDTGSVSTVACGPHTFWAPQTAA